ncbi:MAG: hypothetical protein EP348_00165, partial [Alphaproteobacteria bacterium]
MLPMSYRKVQAALDARLQVYEATAVAFPSRPYYPAQGAPYLEVKFLPSPAKGVLLGEGAVELHSGDYRVIVHDPDRIAAETRIDALRLHFNKGRVLTFEGLDIHLDGASLAADTGDLKGTA